LDFAELERLGIDPDLVLDFSVNSNPYGPSPAVREALARVPLDRYPDREALALRRALSEHLNVSPNQIVVGNGTSELLVLIALAFIRPGDRVLVLEPTFGEYRRVAALMGAQVKVWRTHAEQDFVVEPAEIIETLHRLRPHLCFLCNPNNPTGVMISTETIAAWAQALPETLFVVDEAYLAFAQGLPSATTIEANNILVLRSMTKDYALAGLRLGYAVSTVEIVNTIAGVRPAWNVNALAQAAGVAALSNQAHLQCSLAKLRRDKDKFVAGFENLGLAPLPSAVHFFLVPVGNGSRFRDNLLIRGLLVRDCTSFGLPGYVRIATRQPKENARLLSAIAEMRK
jgi:histidinol-phosphate aminotransferase